MRVRLHTNMIWIALMMSLTVACQQGGSGTEEMSGQEVYRDNCRLCHGADGTLGLSGAADLSRSQLQLEDVKRVIRDGRRTMQAFSKTLSEAEIDSVSAFVMQLRR